MGMALSGCERTPLEPGEARFGQPGEILIQVASPMAGTGGRLDESFVWQSGGSWVLVERLGYANRAGPAVVRNSRLNPGELAPQYATLIRELNEAPGLRIFGTVSQELIPTCSPSQTRVTLTITDRPSGEQARWNRCTEGGFFTLTPGFAGPDAEASRIITAIQLTRSFTLGDSDRSAYLGSVPFGELDRGEITPSQAPRPRAFLSNTGQAPSDWIAFWQAHAGAGSTPPVVDWSTDMVVVAAVGRRSEAGGAVEVRRILPIGGGTRIEVVERVPGDFCSPGAAERYPFQIVVAPRVPVPVSFADVRVERVPCGV